MQTAKAANPMPQPVLPLVFFDGGCPLCRREIEHYRRRDTSGALDWVDISSARETLSRHGLTQAQAMARLHVLDGQSQWQTGAWAFAVIWEHLPGYRWLARSLRALHLLPLLDAAYQPFARWRLRRRCSDDSCSLG